MKQIGIIELKPCFLPKSKVLFWMMEECEPPIFITKKYTNEELILI